MRREIDLSTGMETELPDAPPSGSPPDFPQMDTDALNEALTQDGSVVRAMGEILFGVIKGTIPVTPSLTKQQFVTMLRAKMRS